MRALGLLVLASFLFAACSDDDDDGQAQGGADSTEQAFCDAGERLEAQLSELGSLNVVEEGTDELQRRLDEIQTTGNELRQTGREIAGSEIEAFQEALRQVDQDLGAVRTGDVTSDEATALVNDAIAAGEAAEAVVVKWRETCS
jgi:hypothetical protein